MRKVAIVGVGMTVFGKFPGKTIEELGASAVRDALADAGMSPKDIQTAYCGNLTESKYSGHVSTLTQSILKLNGINRIPMMRVEDACASGSCAVRECWMAVASGLYDIALALGVEKLTAQGQAPLTSVGHNVEGLCGMNPVSEWALRAKRYMHEYGITPAQLARISVKNHGNGCLNPRSQFHKATTVAEVLASAMVSDPLTVLSACPITDGGAAAILCSEEAARRFTTKPVYLAASELTSGEYSQPRDVTYHELEERAGRAAYERAGLGPEDLDFAELHDCFTIAEMIRAESLGICKRGEYARLLDEGRWDLDGAFPVNASGGLLSKGHPVGATGVAQVAELTWQLRDEVQERSRQIKGARAGLGHCSGGVVGDDTGACSVIIVKK
ncbi:MAG: thiolase family protein [Chloroflexi bacterium]|nr:thiolase family protein [Chloroflexota bacterium]